MFKPQRGGGGGGWKGKKSFGGDRGFERPEMHNATCAQCSKPCQVPFRPNGSKPVYCSNCFKREGHEEQRGGFGGGDSFRKPSFGDKRPFKPSFDREERSSG